MVKYEMGVVVRVDLPEDGFTVEMDKVKALIDRFGGTIDKIDEWGRRRLAYPIAKQTEGMYTFITYTADPSAPKEIESRVRLLESVLRFLTVRKDEVEAAVVIEAPVVEEAPAVVEAPAVEEAAPVVEAPVVEEAAPVAEAPAEDAEVPAEAGDE
ncbi:MAG: 30S ribosomal protein S6 [Defluviitaleaceae bacterium]|nr:30S ribosomal protein S6 [Defluviitaleaceae bacterium]MCL2238746.1 30S ribosomal protein S6 [Defluviitaleaceae bacterium]